MEINHILIVEDDKEIREGVEIYLKSQGYKVFRPGTGWKGWRSWTGRRSIWPLWTS